MVPQAITDALTTAVNTSQALLADVPQGTVLTADDITAIGSQLGNIQNAINATAAALATLAGKAP